MGFTWKRAYEGEMVCLGSGAIWFADKVPHSISLEDLKDMVKKNPRKGYYERLIKRRVTLGQAKESGKYDEIGTYREMSTSIDLWRLNPLRKFKKLPTTGQQLLSNVYDSVPNKINEV